MNGVDPRCLLFLPTLWLFFKIIFTRLGRRFLFNRKKGKFLSNVEYAHILSTGGFIHFLENSGNFWRSQGNLREFFSTALVDTMFNPEFRTIWLALVLKGFTGTYASRTVVVRLFFARLACFCHARRDMAGERFGRIAAAVNASEMSSKNKVVLAALIWCKYLIACNACRWKKASLICLISNYFVDFCLIHIFPRSQKMTSVKHDGKNYGELLVWFQTIFSDWFFLHRNSNILRFK